MEGVVNVEFLYPRVRPWRKSRRLAVLHSMEEDSVAGYLVERGWQS
jgi:hypothetical protein